MRKTPPPLQLLPAFEASARLLSFKKAADALHVTPSAISQQIKTLESLVDEALFRREGRRVVLTRVGQDLYAIAQQLLDNYQAEYTELYQRHENPTIRISTMPQIAYDILIPRLPAFQAENPGIDLRIETSDELESFDQKWLDAAIRIGEGDWPGLKSVKLTNLDVQALVAPSYLEMLKDNPESPLTLIHSRTHTDDWAVAAKETGMDFSRANELYFNSYFAAQRAAENGLGVMLALLPLSKSAVGEGRLRPLVDFSRTYEKSCWMAFPESKLGSENFQRFLTWVKGVFAGL